MTRVILIHSFQYTTSATSERRRAPLSASNHVIRSFINDFPFPDVLLVEHSSHDIALSSRIRRPGRIVAAGVRNILLQPGFSVFMNGTMWVLIAPVLEYFTLEGLVARSSEVSRSQELSVLGE